MKHTRKDKRIEIRVTDKQKRKIQKHADEHGMKISEYIILRALENSKQKDMKNYLEMITVLGNIEDVINSLEDQGEDVSKIRRDYDTVWDRMSLLL